VHPEGQVTTTERVVYTLISYCIGWQLARVVNRLPQRRRARLDLLVLVLGVGLGIWWWAVR
jgi:hypothetical protein